MIHPGKYQDLEILRETSVGLYLGSEEEDVLLPNKYCPRKFSIGDTLHVFVYRDSEDRKIATNLKPKIELHKFAFLQVTSITTVGAFMDWGLEKDLLVPYREQKQRMEEGRWYVIYLDLDKQTDRLYGSNKIEKRLSNDNLSVEKGEEVEILPFKRTDIGFNVIVNDKHRGLVFKNEAYQNVRIGIKKKAFVKNIRPDNKIDIALHAIGYDKFNDKNAQLILNHLKKNNGFIPVSDKSPPEEIYSMFGMSKKAFKKAIGALYKNRIIVISSKGVKLN